MIPSAVILALALAAATGSRLAAMRGGDGSRRALVASAFVGASVAIGLVVSAALAAPYSPWDTVRLAPSMAILRGIDPYAGSDSGAVLSTMYGPVAQVAYLPAALAPSPATAATVGRWLAFAFAFAPLMVCCRAGGRSSGRTWWGVVLVGSTLALLMSPALRYSATFLHADAPALGLAGLACLLGARDGMAPACGAALACALSVMTKQTLAPLPLALVAASAWIGGPRRAARLGGLCAVAFLACAGLVLVLFDRPTLMMNLVAIPGGVPWRGRAPGNLLATAAEFLAHAAPLGAALAMAWVRPVLDNRSRDRSRVFLAAALAMVPMAVLGRVKQAGDINSFSPALYPLLLAAACRLSAIAGPSGARARWSLAFGLLALAIPGAGRFVEEVRLLAIERPRDAEAAYLSAHPGTVYFPWNPAAHLAIEGRATHHLFSAWERGVAGFPVAEAHLRSAIPAGALYVAFPLKRLGPTVGFGSCFQMLERHGLLAHPAVPVRLADLPDYECYALTR